MQDDDRRFRQCQQAAAGGQRRVTMRLAKLLEKGRIVDRFQAEAMGCTFVKCAGISQIRAS